MYNLYNVHISHSISHEAVYITRCYVYISGFVNVFCIMYTTVSISHLHGTYFVCMYNLLDVHISHSKFHKAVYLTRCYIYISAL